MKMGLSILKMIIIDDEVSSLGSANFDYRSFKLNFELNAFMYDYKTTKELDIFFLKILKNLLWFLFLSINKEVY